MSAAFEKSHADLETAIRQVEIVKGQLTKQATRLRERDAELSQERERLNASSVNVRSSGLIL